MIAALLMSSLLLVSPGPSAPVCLETPTTSGDDDLRRMYEGGLSYADFLTKATRRVELWRGNTRDADAIDAEVVRRARAVAGTWRFLVVAVDSCSDSVSTIPYLARLVELVEGLELRIVDSTVGRSVMEAHRTPDGRAATPTVVLLDHDWNEAGCFIERPKHLQDWIRENDGRLSRDDVYEGKMEWYADDHGRSTLEEFVAMLEAAAAGRPVCAALLVP